MGLLKTTQKVYYGQPQEFTQSSVAEGFENRFTLEGVLPFETNDPLTDRLSTDLVLTVNDGITTTTLPNTHYQYIKDNSEITLGSIAWRRLTIIDTNGAVEKYFRLGPSQVGGGSYVNEDTLNFDTPLPGTFAVGNYIGVNPSPQGNYAAPLYGQPNLNIAGHMYTTYPPNSGITIEFISEDRKSITLNQNVTISNTNAVGWGPQYISTWGKYWKPLASSKYGTLNNYNPTTTITTLGTTGTENTSNWAIAHTPQLKLSEVFPADSTLSISWTATDFGSYQFISLGHIISGFMISYVGEDKIISKIKRADVQYHAMRGLQELSFDTLKSVKSQEIELPASLTMILPHDYVNYVKLVWVDSAGIEHIIQPTSKTSNPFAIIQDSDGEYTYGADGALADQDTSDTWDKYKSATPSENQDDYQDDTYWPMAGERYGLDPQHAQANGSFFIDELKGFIHFSSNISGKTIILKYISDSLGTDEEMKVHKFAEEALYKHIAYGILSTRMNTPEYIVRRFKREKFAETRKAKLRLSNLKIEELTQILRGKSKQIKH